MRDKRKTDEFDLIARHFAPLSRGEPGAFDLTDDAAILDLTPHCQLVVTMDTLIEGVHFRPEDPPDSVAAKIIGVNLSDLAAMGAKPIAYTLSAAMPKNINDAWIAAFAAALSSEQTKFGITLVGGDTVATPGPLTLTLSAFGSVEKGHHLRRAEAREGDLIYVSGTIGDAALGLRVLQGNLLGLTPQAAAHLIERYQRPIPRVALGKRLFGLVHAAIDVSDGLVADLRHICETSGVDANLELAEVPLSFAAQEALDIEKDLTPLIVTGGDDYELLFSSPPASAPALEAVSASLTVPLTKIGQIIKGKGLVHVIGKDGTDIVFDDAGYRHF